MMEEIEREIRNLLSNGIAGNSIIENLMKIISLYPSKFDGLTEDYFDKFITCFETICTILLTKYSINVLQQTTLCSEVGTSSIEVCLYDFFLEIWDKNIHNDGQYICTFHPESLLVHLLTAMIIAFIENKDNECIKNIYMAMFIALIHDIGKPSSCKKISNRYGCATSFHGHAEIGGVILSRIGNAFIEYFSPEEWYAIVDTVNNHMCWPRTGNYHEDKVVETKLNSLSNLSPDVKDNLSKLRIADKCGSYENVTWEYDTFIRSLSGPFAFAIETPQKITGFGTVQINLNIFSHEDKEKIRESLPGISYTKEENIIFNKSEGKTFVISVLDGQTKSPSVSPFNPFPEGAFIENMWTQMSGIPDKSLSQAHVVIIWNESNNIESILRWINIVLPSA